MGANEGLPTYIPKVRYVEQRTENDYVSLVDRAFTASESCHVPYDVLTSPTFQFELAKLLVSRGVVSFHIVCGSESHGLVRINYEADGQGNYRGGERRPYLIGPNSKINRFPALDFSSLRTDEVRVGKSAAILPTDAVYGTPELDPGAGVRASIQTMLTTHSATSRTYLN